MKELLQYNKLQDSIYKLLAYTLTNSFIYITIVFVLAFIFPVQLYIGIPILIYTIFGIISYYIYNIKKVKPLDRFEMFKLMVSNEVDQIDKDIVYLENDIMNSSELRYKRNESINITVGTFNKSKIQLLKDINLIICMLHEVRHLHQLIELGYDKFEELAFNIDENSMSKNKKLYFSSLLERDAYIYSYINFTKYLSAQLNNEYRLSN